MKLLQLSGGETVIVDDEDYVRLNQYKWYVRKVKSSRRVLKYVVRSAVNEGHKIIIVLSKDVLGCASELCVIHRDGDYLNHTKANLLAATRSEVLGMKLKKRGGTSQYKGVSWKSKKNKWRAQITVNRKIITLGDFQYEEDAARAYDEAALLRHGSLARGNFSNGLIISARSEVI